MSNLPNDDMSAANDLESVETEIENDQEELIVTAGMRLLEARQAKQLNLRDVAEETRQSQDTLAALESMETSHIPASILRLQAKNYARFLGLPEEEIASEYAESIGRVMADAMPAQSPGKKISLQTLMYGGAALVITAAMIGGLSLLMQPSASGSDGDADTLAISARLAPAYASIAEVSDLAAETGEEFGIVANKRAWIEVRGSDGTVFRNREMSPGEVYFPRTGAGWTITVRDGGAFEWQLGDLTAAAVGEPGQALYSISVDGALGAAVDARSAAMAEAPRSGDRPR